MTLCIAAVANKENALVLACDTMLSDNPYAIESMFPKMYPVSRSHRWIGLFAGDPAEWRRIQYRMWDALDGTPETLELIERTLSSAYQAEITRKIELRVLGNVKMTLAHFKKRGLAELGESRFGSLFGEIRATTLETTVMLAGFDEDNNPVILTQALPEFTGTQHERVGFCAIGSGFQVAYGWLWTHYEHATSLSDVIYRVCEAKFMAERARALGVGKRTVVFVIPSSGQSYFIHPGSIEPIRELCDRQRLPVPPDAEEVIRQQWHPFKFGKKRPK